MLAPVFSQYSQILVKFSDLPNSNQQGDLLAAKLWRHSISQGAAMRTINRLAVHTIICFYLHAIALGQNFQAHTLNATSQFSAATAFDINGDGACDVVCGAFWYQGPELQQRFQFRDIEVIRGRFDDYSNLTQDVDLDGDLDIISVNYRSKSLYWVENPGREAMHRNPETRWKRTVIDRPGSSETGRLHDIDGDGIKDILPSGTSFAAWYRKIPTPAGAEPQWQRVELPPEMIGHGIGAGDINGDGRIDLVGPRGWATPASDDASGRWVWHGDFRLAPDCGLPIIVKDIDGDGDSDLIWSRGHNYGIYWTENNTSHRIHPPKEGNQHWEQVEPLISSPQWVTHAIDTSWSSAHTLMTADLDGNGTDEVVAAKRFQGHDGRDPGENAPLRIHAYEFQNATKTWTRTLVSDAPAVGVDLDSVCADLDDDGDTDIIAPTRGGLHWVENLGEANTAQKLPAARPASRVPFEPLKTIVDGEVKTAKDAIEFGQQQDRFRRDFEILAGKVPDSSTRAPLAITVQSIEKLPKYWRLHVTFAGSEAGRVPAWLLIPLEMPKPAKAMLCLHPTQFELGKSQICGLGGKPSRFYAHELAERGFVCLAPDYPGFGEYEYEFGDKSEFHSGTMKAVWDNIRALDLLENLPCVDRDSIGVIGHSLGGHNALFTAMFDGRIRAVVTSCGFTAMPYYRGGDLTGWTSQRYMPRIATFDSAKNLPFDFPEILAAIAPVPIFVSAPMRDDNFAVEGVKRTEAAVRPVYELLAKPGSCKFLYPAAEHDFPEEIRKLSYEWLDQSL
ncbi:MAG: hypothetical protein Aurels2KO_20670 [Aureliella sp.]